MTMLLVMNCDVTMYDSYREDGKEYGKEERRCVLMRGLCWMMQQGVLMCLCLMCKFCV